MAENYLIGMAEEIKSYIPGTSNIEEGDSKITINAELKTGIKGISVAIECAPNTVKIKGTQEYKYPISEEAVEEFQQEMMEKYSGCNVYVSGQVFAFSKFFSYQTVEEAVKTTEEIIDAMQDAVVTFENDCVNFLEKDVEAKEEDYNPEENVNLVHVDNAYHAVSTTMQDTEDYEEEHRKFAEKIFRDLAAEIGGTLNGNEVILTDEKEKITTDCIFFPLDAEILVSVSTPADNDAGTIYVSYINANYPELMAAYDADNEVFKVRTYSSPDKYAPDETKERLDLCRTALIACMKEYERTLKKKDSADFAVKDNGVSTDYKNYIYGSTSNGIRLSNDQIRGHVNVSNGFQTVPPGDNIDADDYMDDIDAIWNNADSDDDVAWATARFQVGVLQQQADNNYQDADMEKIQYDQTEAGLVYQAQQLMVTYEQSRYNMENLQSARNLMQAQYEATAARQAAGMATQADVLSALKSVQDQDTAILTAQKSADNVHRSLCLMLGWAVDGQPEIRDVPEPDLNRIASMNPDADMETAIANNYDVKYFEKKAGNLTSQYLIDSNQAQIQDAKDKAAKSLRNQYNTVLTGRDSLNAAVMALDVASVNLNTATAKRAVGEITELEYQNVLNSYISAKNSVETDKLQLLLAMEAYDWNVKGLTTSN